MEEGGHLASGDLVVRAVPVIGRWVTTFGDACCTEFVDVGFEDRVVIVDEEVAFTVVHVAEGSDEESGAGLS
jgi:hypothetical protein